MQRLRTTDGSDRRTRGPHGQSVRATGVFGTGLSLTELTALLIITLLLIVGTWVTLERQHSSVDMKPLRVESGDTLWKLAQQHPIPGLTTAETVQIIADASDVRDGRVAPGDDLQVPVDPRGQELASR